MVLRYTLCYIVVAPATVGLAIVGVPVPTAPAAAAAAAVGQCALDRMVRVLILDTAKRKRQNGPKYPCQLEREEKGISIKIKILLGVYIFIIIRHQDARMGYVARRLGPKSLILDNNVVLACWILVHIFRIYHTCLHLQYSRSLQPCRVLARQRNKPESLHSLLFGSEMAAQHASASAS